MPIILIIIGLFLGNAQKNSLKNGKPSFVIDTVRSILLPIDSGFNQFFGFADSLKTSAMPRSKLLKENARLRTKVKNLSAENLTLKEAFSENITLKKELGFSQSIKYSKIPAVLISHRASSWFDTATINIGLNNGVEKGSAVVNHLGIIGQIVDVGKYASVLVSLTDPNSSVGAMVQRSRSKGIAVGQYSDYILLEYLKKDADILKNDIIVTSGDGKVIPKGFPIGRVINIERDSVSGTTRAYIRPSVRFDELEHVFIIKPGDGN